MFYSFLLVTIKLIIMGEAKLIIIYIKGWQKMTSSELWPSLFNFFLPPAYQLTKHIIYIIMLCILI